MKTINETFKDIEFDKLVAKKGKRTWRKAILEEFNIEEEVEDEEGYEKYI